MAAGHPDQVRLRAFLDHAEALIGDQVKESEGQLALRLDVGLPPDVDPLKHHDLDNYLFPLVGKLGPDRFASVWGTKGHGDGSYIRIERAERVELPPQHRHVARTTRSAETRAWMRELQDQLDDPAPIPRGPVELQVSFRVGPGRNWANLWKRTVDSLDPLLGREVENREWNPCDGRVVRLGLHNEVASTIGHAIDLCIVASPSALS